MFNPGWRASSIRALDDTFDIVVIGGGITGCGIALDSVQRGLRTLLLEKGDIASGTSSRSSKLIHGGLRYLKQMQFRITRLACRERDRMLNLNPHLVSEIQFLYPAYHGDKTPGWQVDLGLWMYDQLTGRPDKHTQLNSTEIRKLAPDLTTRGLDRGLSYNDALADDARLTLAVAATAHAYGASILTQAEVVDAITGADGRIHGLLAKDLESGAQLEARGRVIINSTGVWTDAVRERLGLSGQHLRPSRGIHLILSRNTLQLEAAVTIPSPDDGRPLFLIPHPEGILVGTTDTYHDGDLDDPKPTSDEISYLLRAIAAAFPGRQVSTSEIRGSFAGLRPILDTYADDPSEASREEDIWEERGALSVAGGKLTTWRSTAETAVDSALRLLPEETARRTARCATKGIVLAGLAPPDLAQRLAGSGVPAAVASGLARRLGNHAWLALAAHKDDQALDALDDGLDLCPAEVHAHFAWGGARHLDDLLIRRIRLGMWEPDTAVSILPKIRESVCAATGWDNERWDREIESFDAALQSWRFHAP